MIPRSISPDLLEPAVHGSDEVASTPECLTTDEILQLLLGSLPETKRENALEHIAQCSDCRVLFGSAAQALDDTGSVAPSSRPGVFQTGMLVAHRYRVERFLARGGMGEVYAVHDQVLNERVALKTVRSEPSNDVKAIRRLKSEALLSRRIGHANVCRIFDFGEHEVGNRETVCFLTMELVEGETLGARLRRGGPLPVEHVSILLRQVLGGLAEAHALGIVHRDLKSENIMLREPTATGSPVDAVVMDFGLAFRVDADERLTSDTHALVGSAAYMSPEQVEGQRLTPATDVYALGVILFEALTGQLPFRAATPISTAMLRLHSAPPLPSSLRPELDRYWDRLVMSCLQRALTQRFGSAREVLAAIDRPEALLELDSSSALSTPVQKRRSHATRVRTLAVGAAVVVALFALWVASVLPFGAPPATVEHTSPLTGSAKSSSAPPPSVPLTADPPSTPPPEPVPPATPALDTLPLVRTREAPAAGGQVPPAGAPAARKRHPKPAPPPSPPEVERAVSDVAAPQPVPRKETASVPPTPLSPLEPLPLDPEFPE